jgi:hypothetical protein
MQRNKSICGWLVLGMALTSGGNVNAQAAARKKGGSGPGSTIEGDVLKGEGQFLKGMGWYELRSAKARAKDTETQLQWERWSNEIVNASRKEAADSALKKLAIRNTRDEKARRALAEHDRRLRENPTLDDVRSGDALNAILIDLFNPSVLSKSSRSDEVELPSEFSLRLVVYRFVTPHGNSKAGVPSNNVLDLQRLRAPENWPIYLRMEALKGERDTYEKAIGAVVTACKARNLNLDAVLALDRAIADLKKRVATTVPSDDGMRMQATRFVDDLGKAAKLFKTLDFAQELVGDIEEHDAHTVLELLAFMSKFRLLFGDTQNRPEAGRLYVKLYALFKQQTKALGLKDELVPKASADTTMAPAKSPARTASVAIKAKEYLERVKQNLADLKYARRPKKDTSRDDVLAELNAAIKEIDSGKSSKDRLEKIRKQIDALREISTKNSANVKNLKDATESFAAAIKILE